MNMQNLMAQAQRLQKEITRKKDELDKMEFTGKSEWVEVVYYGNKELKSLRLLVDKVDDNETLEDMIKIASSDAYTKINKETEAKLGMYGSMGLF